MVVAGDMNVVAGDMNVVADDMNAHLGDRTVTKRWMGLKRQRGQDLVEMLARNQLVVVNPFFQKRESHKITYRSGNNRTEIDLLIVRSCQRNKVRDCKVLAGEHITSQHKPLVFKMWIGSSGYLKNKGMMWKQSGQHLKGRLCWNS